MPYGGKRALQAAAAAVAADGLCAFARPAEMVTCDENDAAAAHMHLFERARAREWVLGWQRGAIV